MRGSPAVKEILSGIEVAARIDRIRRGTSFSRRLLVQRDRHLACGRRCEPSSALTIPSPGSPGQKLYVEQPCDSVRDGPPYLDGKAELGANVARVSGSAELFGAPQSCGKRFGAGRARSIQRGQTGFEAPASSSATSLHGGGVGESVLCIERTGVQADVP